jgi:hypothetical protein
MAKGHSLVVLSSWLQFIQIFSVLPAKFAAPVHAPGLLEVVRISVSCRVE